MLDINIDTRDRNLVLVVPVNVDATPLSFGLTPRSTI